MDCGRTKWCTNYSQSVSIPMGDTTDNARNAQSRFILIEHLGPPSRTLGENADDSETLGTSSAKVEQEPEFQERQISMTCVSSACFDSTQSR